MEVVERVDPAMGLAWGSGIDSGTGPGAGSVGGGAGLLSMEVPSKACDTVTMFSSCVAVGGDVAKNGLSDPVPYAAVKRQLHGIADRRQV